MELGLSNTLLAGDPRLVDHIVGEVKSQGIFDQFRKECIADVDTKPAYQNLHTRVEGSVNSFLGKQIWKPDLNKNQLRETLRKHIHDAPYLDAGVERIVDQVVNPKVYSVFMPQIEDVVYKFLGLERPKTREKNGGCGLKDLLPKDLDPVSPESDKNSLKDVSLESMDAIDDLEPKKEEKTFGEHKIQNDEMSDARFSREANTEDGQMSLVERTEETGKNSNKSGSNLNISGKSDDKTEEEEEDSPTFEPIDIMNLNESNISNDSHLSGISELTSHRSRTPDFCNELSRDNFDYSNQDSQLSKVSSDSRLSIVTDLGSSNHASNHASTPLQDSSKDDGAKEKCDKTVKDNFKAVRDFDASKIKNAKGIFEMNKCKDSVPDTKDSKSSKSSLSSKENSRDATDNSVKEKYDHKHSKEKSKESDSAKHRSKDKNHVRDSKYHKDKSSERKKERSHSNSGKYDKYDKNKSKERNDQVAEKPRENSEKMKDSESPKESVNKVKDERTKDQEKKDSTNKEVKDLKDLYKEKIRELREKKELTEKEKLNKDNKDIKTHKENRDKKESPRDKKPYKKNHKSSSSRSSSTSGHENRRARSPEKVTDGKERRSESRDKGKRDERRQSKDGKPKIHVSGKSDVSEKSDKSDSKRAKTEERNDKYEIKKDTKLINEKSNLKKDTKNHHSQSKSLGRNDKVDAKRDNKSESQNRDKKRKEEKKPKPKDDHSSLRKDTNDRRSSDRDGSNGSSSKSSQSSTSNLSSSSNKSNSSNFLKETGSVCNSSSETSDSVEESQRNEFRVTSNSSNMDNTNTSVLLENSGSQSDTKHKSETQSRVTETDSSDVNLPLKKRPLISEDAVGTAEVKLKKPKFAKNFHEAKKLMKIRKQMEKQHLKENQKSEKKSQPTVVPVHSTSARNTPDNFETVPDEERVQIIEVRDEEYEEPYPEQQTNLTLEARSMILFEGEPCSKDLLEAHSNLKLKLSDMELCIGQSLSEESCSSSKTVKEAIIGPSPSDPPLEVTLPEEKEATPLAKLDESTDEKAVEDALPENSQSATPVEQESISVVKEEKDILPKTSDIDASNECKVPEEEVPCAITEKISNEANESNVDLPTTSKPKEQSEESSVTKIEDPIGKESLALASTSAVTEENEDCHYFKDDSKKCEKFANFLESFDLMGNNSLEDIIKCLGGQVVSSLPKAMAPPLPKRKLSSSPLTDILLNNSDNNNDAHKRISSSPSDEALNSIKKRKLFAPKKQRVPSNVCAPQGLLNGENFVMPLSPESDVSATSEKIPSASLIKEEKGRHRSSQRYSSDDLYKPRPLFSSSSRRCRRSNQA